MLKSSIASILRPVTTGSLVLAALLGTSLCAVAGPEFSDGKDSKKNVIQQTPTEPKWWFDLAGTAELDMDGPRDITSSPALFFSKNGNAPLPAQFTNRSFDYTHYPVGGGTAELGYKVLPYLSVFIGFGYNYTPGGYHIDVGTVTDPTGVYGGGAGTRYKMFGNFHRYQAYTGMAGIKLNTPRTILDFIHAPKFISPYLSLSAGGKVVEDQKAQFYAKYGRLFSTSYLLLYDNTPVFTAEAQLGYDLKITRNFDITIETGYGYDTKPDSDAIAGIAHANRGGDRLYSTYSLGAKYKF